MYELVSWLAEETIQQPASSDANGGVLVGVVSAISAIVVTGLTIWGKRPGRVNKAMAATDRQDKLAEKNYNDLKDQYKDEKAEGDKKDDVIRQRDRVIQVREQREHLLWEHIFDLYRDWGKTPEPTRLRTSLPEIP